MDIRVLIYAFDSIFSINWLDIFAFLGICTCRL